MLSDESTIDVDALHKIMSTMWWREGIARESVVTCLEHSYWIAIQSQKFGDEKGDRLIGVARAITDFATQGRITDVWIDPDHRRKGLASWMIKFFVTQSKIKSLKHLELMAADSEVSLYTKGGFKVVDLYREEGIHMMWFAKNAGV